MRTAAVRDVYLQEDQCAGLPTIPHISPSEIQRAQLADPCIREVITEIQTGVITDHFTTYAIAIPTVTQKAKTVAECSSYVFMAILNAFTAIKALILNHT